MEIYLTRKGNNLAPCTIEDSNKIAKLEKGKQHLFKVLRIRNEKHHKKYFALLKIAFDNQEEFQDKEQFRKVMQMLAGNYEVVLVADRNTGEVVKQYWPKSIAFDKMGQTKFEELYSKVMDEICKRYDFDPELMENEVKKEI